MTLETPQPLWGHTSVKNGLWAEDFFSEPWAVYPSQGERRESTSIHTLWVTGNHLGSWYASAGVWRWSERVGGSQSKGLLAADLSSGPEGDRGLHLKITFAPTNIGYWVFPVDLNAGHEGQREGIWGHLEILRLADGHYTYCVEHSVMCIIMESPCCTPETTIVHVDYTSI